MGIIENLLGIKYPLFQGGMTMIANYKLVSAVSNAGGLGILASAGLTKDELRAEIKKTKELTKNPFAVNLMLMNKNIPELIDVIIEESVKIVSTGAGTPKPYMEKLKENNIKVIAVIPNVKVAKKMEDIGVDIVVAEGGESGGHVGETTTLSLVPQIVDAVNIPVIAAGGIADGRGIAAAFSLGAKGVQLGTLFLTTEECVIPNSIKQAIIDAVDTSTTVVGRQKGIPFRSIKNDILQKYYNLELGEGTKEDLDRLKNEALSAAIVKGDSENGLIMVGQISGLITRIRPVKEVVETLFIEYNETIKKLQEI
ncbi:DUF561 domain-containing protein [Gemella sp. GH3]|uniref:NAD(P)H-dependent flavin oxidoreductase n=1 Tax=unclassified Gemella TaxID=2624949 RepID=UPI0015CFF12A|nr:MULTISPECIES: DUF561 domain-containing protein [unclassified Gemella]MBF0713470.1 DUF561 domain-containing protein [Gemella sp. GH3.1]NYS50422.1 DUF561 domain-containing protein [Gemella sp. GH3]